MKLKVEDNKKYIKVVESTQKELTQLKLSLKKQVKNFHFMKNKMRYKNYDGTVDFLDKYNRVPFGLWAIVNNICNTYNYDLEIEGLDSVIDYDFDDSDFRRWAALFFENSNKKPRDYQIDACINILKWRWSVSEIATSAGKTLIVFMVFAYLKQKQKLKRMLVVVPSVSLVLQGVEDFDEFSDNRNLIRYRIQTIGGGAAKKTENVDIIFGTFQSLRDMPVEFFSDIDVLCVDECHTASNNSLVKIITMCTNANLRFGLSGTTGVKSEDADAYKILSLLGPLVNKVSADFLFGNNIDQKKYATPVSIRCVYMNYLTFEEKQMLYKLKEQKQELDGKDILNIEKEIVINNKIRFDYVTNVISNVKKNSLVLFHDVKRGYGKRIQERLKDICDDNYEVYYVDGSTPQNVRNKYFDRIDTDGGKIKILVASYGTLSTGISINNLHYLFLTESFKSEKIILQTLGRGMRLHSDKDTVVVVDFVDDFSFGPNYNILVKQAKERENMYKKENFKYKVVKKNLI